MTPKRFARLRSILDCRQHDLTVMMDNVHKPHNVSAIIRTCDAVGVLEIHAVSRDPRFEASAASASGAQRYVGIRLHPSHDAAFGHLRAHGFQVLAAHYTAEAKDFRAVDYTAPTAILLGTELDGVSAAALAAADGTIKIPMLGAVTSLNVSVAAAVILFEAQRQRAAAGCYDRSRLEPERRHQLLFEWAYPRLATFCREKGIAYPRLGEDGTMLDPLPRG